MKCNEELGKNDVIVMATDGLWDVVSNKVCISSFHQPRFRDFMNGECLFLYLTYYLYYTYHLKTYWIAKKHYY